MENLLLIILKSCQEKWWVVVGEMFERYKGEEAVLSSGKGYGEFMDRLKGKDSFSLWITWV